MLALGLLVAGLAAPSTATAAFDLEVTPLKAHPTKAGYYTGTFSASSSACKPLVLNDHTYPCYVGLTVSWGYVGLNAGTITIAGIGGEDNSAVSLSRSFEIFEPYDEPAFLQLEVRSFGYAQPPDAEYVRVPLCFPQDRPCASIDQPKIRALRQAREVLKKDRKKMLDAVKLLEDRNEVFCSVSSYLLGRLEPHEAVDKGWDEACGRIPGLVKAYVDADRKLDRNAELIRKLDREINRLEGGGRAAAFASSLGSSASGWPATPLVASRAGGQAPLAALNAARKRALAGIASLSKAIGKGKLSQAKGLARTAASKLKALPEACSAAKRYLKKNGLGTRFSRAKILRALRQLKAKPLPRRVARFANALHLSPAKMKRLVRKAKSVPKAHVRAMGVSDLICDPRLAAIDGSLAKAFQKLASGL